MSAVLAALQGFAGPSTELRRLLLEIEYALGEGYAQSWALHEYPDMFLLAFRTLAEVRHAEACMLRAPYACYAGVCWVHVPLMCRAATFLLPVRLLGAW